MITDIAIGGAAVRFALRARLDLIGMRWTEHKGWLESHFVVTGSPTQWAALRAWIREVNA